MKKTILFARLTPANSNYKLIRLKRETPTPQFIMENIRLAIFICFIIVSASAASAQTTEKALHDNVQTNITNGEDTKLSKIVFDLNLDAGTSCNNMAPVTLNVSIGYRFIPRLYAYARIGGMLGLYSTKDGDARAYTRSPAAGGGIGCNVFRIGRTDIDLTGTVTSSIGNADYKHVAYEATALLRFRLDKAELHIGLGFKHISSRSSGFNGYNGLIGTIGIGI